MIAGQTPAWRDRTRAMGREVDGVVRNDLSRSFGKHDRPIREEYRLGRRMSDKDDGHARGEPQLTQLFIETLAGDFVEGRERFVQ